MKTVIILVITTLAIAYQAAKADQFLSADCESDPSRITVYYGATNPSLVGIGFRMHWDSSKITYSHIDDSLEHSYFGSYGPIDDWKDTDNDPGTDKLKIFVWVNMSSPPRWPGLYATKLFDFVLSDFEDDGFVGNVKFSVIDNSARHDVFWTGC